MGDSTKKGFAYFVIGLTPTAILSIVIFGTSNPKEDGSAIKELAQTFIDAGPFGLVALICIIMVFILGHLALKSKQETIQFMQKIIDTGKEEIKENHEFSNIQTKAYQELAITIKENSEKLKDLIHSLAQSERRIMKRIEAMALADSNVDKSKYLSQRGED